MTDELTQAAMTTWAAKDLPARLLAAQVAKLLNCTPEDVAILVSAGKLRPLGRPNPNAVKFFSAVELIALLADREWLDDATKTIGQFWRRKNARRRGLTTEKPDEAEMSSVVPKSKNIQRTFDAQPRFLHDMGINLGRGHAFMPQQSLQGADVHPRFEHVRRKGMAQAYDTKPVW